MHTRKHERIGVSKCLSEERVEGKRKVNSLELRILQQDHFECFRGYRKLCVYVVSE